MKWSSRKKRHFSCSSRRRTTSTRSSTSSWTIIGTKSGSSWSSWEKPQWNGRTEAISRPNIRQNCEEKLVEDRDTILELTDKIQELQNEIYSMNDSRDFKDAESVRSGHSHVASQPVSFPPHPIPGGTLSCSLGMPSRKDGPPSIFGTHMVSRETFLQIQQRLLQHFIRRNWIHGVPEQKSRFTHP